VVTMRPPPRPMEERTERVVGMRNVQVSDSLKPFALRCYGLKRCDRHLNVDDRFGAEPGNRGRANMVDAQGQRSKRRAKTVSLCVEGRRPTRIIGHHLNHSLVNWQSRLCPDCSTFVFVPKIQSAKRHLSWVSLAGSWPELFSLRTILVVCTPQPNSAIETACGQCGTVN
jgi:hypothetical protein